MDGHFVPNISIGVPVLKSLRQYTQSACLDTHLMIAEPEKYIDVFAEAEATVHHHRVLRMIRSHNIKAGIALNPSSEWLLSDELLEETDLILVMTVNPGFGGQSFIPQMLKKISRLKARVRHINPDCLIEADGGIGVNNIRQAADAGADILVAGNALFNPPDHILQNITSLQAALKN
ncbi:hypothetical protein CHS0354_035252 [Potamilus streckersoni]|uniref:Ribulose-phosphate 3-epimerase n=1 Tax=Potamilus streckersoni TaxID=2493646 RepID=A0AAE0S2N7_9BIVA|nr:hypothetical protein CHS0354_035252 [Potamilus streckersoni]